MSNFLVNVGDVNTWLKDGLLNIQKDDQLLEQTLITPMVVGTFSNVMDTSTWISRDTTPIVVRSIIAIKVAAARYRTLTGMTEDDMFVESIEMIAKMLIEGICSGIIDVKEAIDSPQKVGFLEFFPDDTTEPNFTLDDEF